MHMYVIENGIFIGLRVQAGVVDSTVHRLIEKKNEKEMSIIVSCTIHRNNLFTIVPCSFWSSKFCLCIALKIS